MEHERNNLFQDFPITKTITGIVMVFIAIFSAIEWNRETGSCWGYVFFAIAVPGVFLPFIEIYKKFFRDKKK